MYQQNARTFWQAYPQQIFYEESGFTKRKKLKKLTTTFNVAFLPPRNCKASYLMQVLRKWRNKLILKSTITSNIWYENFIFNSLRKSKY